MDKNTIKNRVEHCPKCGSWVREWFDQGVLIEMVCSNQNCTWKKEVTK